MRLALSEYPSAIASVQRTLLNLDQEISQHSEVVYNLETRINRRVAFDASLKNEAQRKQRTNELMQFDPDLIQVNCRLNALKFHRNQVAIDLELLCNSFSVAKLEVRASISVKGG